jgi:MATE family multidrug resistance protein
MPLGYALAFTSVLVPAMGAAGFWVGLTGGLISASALMGWRLFGYNWGWARPKASA